MCQLAAVSVGRDANAYGVVEFLCMVRLEYMDREKKFEESFNAPKAL